MLSGAPAALRALSLRECKLQAEDIAGAAAPTSESQGRRRLKVEVSPSSASPV